jgi:hypothetical protein
MGDVSLDMIWKRLGEMQGDLQAVLADVAELKDTARSLAKSHVVMQRDIRALTDRVNILTVAFGDDSPHTHA